MFSSKDLFFTPAAGGYTVSKSLRFRSGSTTYLNRSPASASNQTTWTLNFWVKLGDVSTSQITFLSAGNNADANRLTFYKSGGNIGLDFAGSQIILTSAVYRDPSAWYMITLALDTTQTTSSNRVRLYVNGVQVTNFSFTTYPALNATSDVNSTKVHYIGRDTFNNSRYFDGYFAETNFLDGYPTVGGTTYNATTWAALNVATLFGAYDTNGIWQPAAYTGNYGTNGYYLKFTDVGATSGSNTGYGKDFAGTNYWTTNNFGTTSNLTTYDSMLDSPTNATGDIGNYCVLNPLDSAATISNGNLTQTKASADGNSRSTFQIPSSGLWYVEATATSTTNASTISCGFGLATASASLTANSYNLANAWNLYSSSLAYINRNGTPSSSLGFTLTAGDVVQIAVDPANNRAWIGRNDTWYDSGTGTTGNPSSGTNPTVSSLPAGLFIFANTFAQTFDVNFGQRPFVKTVPTSYSALNTQNLTTPTITNGAQYMAATTYTGNGTSITVSNSANNTIGTTFQPDFVWVKNRTNANDHILVNSIVGANINLYSNRTTAQVTNNNGGYINSFNVDGFTPITGSTNALDTNATSNNYVGWQWKAGGTGVTNTSGSITSTVSANATAGFSVVTYTANGASSQTIGHGLGVIPAMVITKCRSAGSSNWAVYHQSVGNTGALFLNLTNSTGTSSLYWNNTTPTSTVFSVGSNNTDTNFNTNTMVAYCFAPVAGYSAFGSYTGNASTDGPFVYTGFRPRWIMIKNSSVGTGGYDWVLIDTSRSTYNAQINWLYADLSSAEYTTAGVEIDILSNGFKLRTTNAAVNGSTNTMIYAAFAENPFKISRAR